MTFEEILKPEGIRIISGCSSKKRLLQNVAEFASSLLHIESPVIFSALLERENLGPTGVGHGVALPHARLSGIQTVQGAFLLLDKPVPYDAVDKMPVDLVFALFAPEDAGVQHLKALALVSRTLRQADVCAKLRANPEPSTLHALLSNTMSSEAA